MRIIEREVEETFVVDYDEFYELVWNLGEGEYDHDNRNAAARQLQPDTSWEIVEIWEDTWYDEVHITFAKDIVVKSRGPVGMVA